MTKRKGWKGESHRHNMATKGIKTTDISLINKNNHFKLKDKNVDSEWIEQKNGNYKKVPLQIIIEGVPYKALINTIGGYHIGMGTFWKGGAERMAEKVEELSKVGQKAKIVKVGYENDTGEYLYAVYINEGKVN